MFQLILPFQLELPFDGARASAPRADGRATKLARRASPAQRGGRPRADRKREIACSLELPLPERPSSAQEPA